MDRLVRTRTAVSDLGDHDTQGGPFVLADLFNDPRNVRFLLRTIDTLTTVVKFRARKGVRSRQQLWLGRWQ